LCPKNPNSDSHEYFPTSDSDSRVWILTSFPTILLTSTRKILGIVVSLSPLVLYVPLHVDDGLGITNSQPLHAWFLLILLKRLHVVNLGQCSKFLNILIIRDRASHRLWLSSHNYISDLLGEWNLTACCPVLTLFPSNLPDLSSAPPNSLPSISDADLLPQYQHLIGCLLYLAVTTHPDISYYAMWLGQYNVNPTRSHFLLAKHVLRYLLDT
jgi:hypothetical protein